MRYRELSVAEQPMMLQRQEPLPGTHPRCCSAAWSPPAAGDGCSAPPRGKMVVIWNVIFSLPSTPSLKQSLKLFEKDKVKPIR